MDLSRLCIHTITTKPWGIDEAIAQFSEAGVSGISVWREAVEGRNLADVKTQIADAGLTTISYVRGGFFPSTNADRRSEAIENNKAIIEEAAELGAPLVVLVCGADPGQSLQDSVSQIQDGIGELLPFAESAGVKLGIEPLHPVYADTRSAIVSLGQANDVTEALDHDHIGVVLDVYHVWWDPNLFKEIDRCVLKDNLFAFHVCDWRVPTRDPLNDREIMGKGCIDIPAIRNRIEDLGYDGFIEVEIFSDTYWAQDQKQFLDQIIAAYQTHV